MNEQPPKKPELVTLNCPNCGEMKFLKRYEHLAEHCPKCKAKTTKKHEL